MRKLLGTTIVLALIAFVAFWIVTMPATVSSAALPPRAADLANGREMFYAGGCPACHAVPRQEDRTQLGGGLALNSPFGTFYVPNISPDPEDGIGRYLLNSHGLRPTINATLSDRISAERRKNGVMEWEEEARG